jgi:hypothetical protein
MHACMHAYRALRKGLVVVELSRIDHRLVQRLEHAIHNDAVREDPVCAKPDM